MVRTENRRLVRLGSSILNLVQGVIMIETKPQAATSVWRMGSNIAEQSAEAVSMLSSGNLARAIQDVPRLCYQLAAEVSRLQAKGWRDDVLGPVIFDLVDGDPARSWAANYESDYETFKTAVSDFATYVALHGDWGTVDLDESLRPRINLTATEQEKTDLTSKLQAIVDSFPSVGG